MIRIILLTAIRQRLASMVLGLTGIVHGEIVTETIVPGVLRTTVVGVPAKTRPRVLLISIAESDGPLALAAREYEKHYNENAKKQRSMELELIRVTAPGTVRFPPDGDAYRDQTAAAHAVWRELLVRMPDVLVITEPPPLGLVEALAADPRTKGIEVQRVAAKNGMIGRIKAPGANSSPVGQTEWQARMSRSPMEVARELERHYGHELGEAVYIPAVAIMARLRLGPDALAEAEQLAARFVNGSSDSLARASGSHLAGHLLFADLAERTGKPEYVRRVDAAATMGFDPSTGVALEAMPFHNRMSDAVFMGCPILVKAATLTGKREYLDMALRHYRFMRALDMRADGLWRHSPRDESAWGRGNAFALLGLALTLEDLPRDHPAFDEMLTDFRTHAAALVRQQTSDGMWRQIVDDSESYREYTATAMIGTALLKGIRRGWLGAESYQGAVERAWTGVKARTWADGTLMDVCESTGAQASREEYLRRKAILGRDARGGAMGLLFATELAVGR